tara:strand:- start:258 stop:644 length:387 start_codon:yes stop_codon:yes gene_type:complete
MKTEVKRWRERCLEHPNIMFGTALKNARSRAAKKNIPFDITRKYIKDIFENQNGECYYSGLSLNIVKGDPMVAIDPLKMTLDCIDPSKGYVMGNVAWCAYCVNALKQRMSEEELINICKAVVIHNNAL